MATGVAPSYAAQPAGVQPVGLQPVKGSGSGGGLIKVLLIVFVILVGLGLLSAAGLFWAAHKVKNAIRVEENGKSSKVQLPGFSASSNTDPNQVARELGVDVYPGAKGLDGASSVTIGSLKVGNVEFETSDPMDKVQRFYKARFPRSDVNVSDENSATIVALTGKEMVTITLDRRGEMTRINISRTAGQNRADRSGESQ
jgi:hypothetical protein